MIEIIVRMASRFKKNIYAGLLLAFFLLPVITLAQQAAHTPSGLVPCGAVSGFLNILGATECGLCDLVQLFQNIINFLLGVTIPLSIALFAWAGVMYFAASGNPKQIIRAHKIFKSVLIGFIVALAAWLVVQTVLNALVSKNFFTSGSWNTLQCAQDDKRPRSSNISEIFGFITGGQGGITVSPSQTGATGDAGVALNTQQINEKYGTQIASACQNVSVPNCTEAVAALIAAESSGKPEAVSKKGALGLMQLMPANGGRTCGTGDTACITEQVQKGVAHFAREYTATQNNLQLTYAAYNGGQSAVQPSACCASGYAYQCDWDCGTRAAHAVDCTASPRPSVCVPNTGYQETRNYVNKLCSKVGC